MTSIQTTEIAYISSGERVTVLTSNTRNLGYGSIQFEVIYSDGSHGWEHPIDLLQD